MEGGEVGRIDLSSQPFDVDFHPSSSLLVTGLINGKVELYEYGEEEPRRKWSLGAHTESCRAVRFSDAGRFVLSASPDKSILAIDVTTGQSASRLVEAHAAAINRLIVLTDTTIATGDDDGVVKIWDTRQNQCCHTFNVHEDFISDMTCGPSSNQLIVTSGDGSLSVCHVRNHRVDARSEIEEDELLSVVVVKHGRKVVCGTQDGVLLVYSWGYWNGFSDRYPGHPNSIDAILKVDEDTIVTGSSDGLIRVVSILPNKMLGVIGEHSEYPIERLAYSFDKRFMASASHDKSLKLWDVAYLLEQDGDDDGNGNGVEGEAEDVPMGQADSITDAPASLQTGDGHGSGEEGGGADGGGATARAATGRRNRRQGGYQQEDDGFFDDL